MGAMGKKLRNTTDGIAHWCPACEEVHHFATAGKNASGAQWTFDGNAEAPTFTPSMLIRWGRYADPNWRPPEGEEDNYSGICHYILTAGVINYCGDCTHALVGQSVPLPDWPYAPGTYGGVEE